MLTILKNIDADFLLNTINRNNFKENFYSNATNQEIKNYIKELLSE